MSAGEAPPAAVTGQAAWAAPAPHRPREPDAVAGLALRQPLWAYEVTGLSFGSARLERGEGRPRLRDGFVLTLWTEPASPSPATTGREPQTYRFRVPRAGYLLGARGEEWPRALRALIVDCGLLAAPEAIVGGSLPEPWTRILAPDLHAPATEALDELGRRYQEFVSLNPGHGGSARCEACPAEPATTRSRVQASRDYDFARGGYLAQGKGPCQHFAWGVEAQKAVCEQHPELTLELAGVLMPALPVGPSAERAYDDAKIARRIGLERYVLTPEILDLVLTHWLLDRTDAGAYRAVYGAAYDSGHGSLLGRRLRRYYDFRRTRLSGSISIITPEAARVREALAYCTHCWGVSEPPEAMIYRGDDDLDQAEALALPVLEPRALVEPPMVLTEDPSAEADPPTPTPRGVRRRAVKRAR